MAAHWRKAAPLDDGLPRDRIGTIVITNKFDACFDSKGQTYTLKTSTISLETLLVLLDILTKARFRVIYNRVAYGDVQ